VDHHYVDVNGVRLHYVEAGEGPLMVFVHGFPEFWYEWKVLQADFARDHRAVTYDQRGFNLSGKPAEVAAYRAKPLIEDLRQLIEHLTAGQDKKSVILVAHDWGGAVAWTFAAAFPQYVEKLVIINSPHSVPFARALVGDPEQQAASQYMLTLRSAAAEALLSNNDFEYLEKMFVDAQGKPVLSAADMALYKQAWAQPGALSASLNFYRASPLYPPTADDPGAAKLTLDAASLAVKMPTLMIWGESDHALRPSLLDGIEEVVPDLRLKRIPEGSHWVIHEQPQRIIGYIREFLAE